MLRRSVTATAMLVALGSAAGPSSAQAVQPLTVTVEGDGHVTSTPQAIDCPPVCKADFKDFEKVTLTATPSSGWTFQAWGGDCSGAGACEVVMDTQHAVTATFTQPPPPPPPPAPKPSGPPQSFSFDDMPPGALPKGAIQGVAFPIPAQAFIPRTTAPSSYPQAIGLDSCRSPGKGSALPMAFDIPLTTLSLRAGFDDRPAPAGGTFGRLVGYDAAGKPVADSGDVALARPGGDGAITSQVAVTSDAGAIASATLYVGAGTVSHDTGARCAAIDDLIITGTAELLLGPSVTISTEEGATFAQTYNVGISGSTFAPHDVEAFCMTTGDVRVMPPDCNWIFTIPDPRDPSRSLNEPLRAGRFTNLRPPGLRRGSNRVTVWIRDGRNQVASASVNVEVTGESLTYDALIRGVEVTQAVQQFALPRFDRVAAATAEVAHTFPAGFYSGVQLAAGGRTVVRVFPQYLYSGTTPLRGLTARLWAYPFALTPRAPLPGGPLAPIGGPLTLAASTDYSAATVNRMRADPNGGFTFVLPSRWTAAGGLTLVAELVPPEGTARLSEAPGAAAANNNAAGVFNIPFEAMQAYRLAVVALDSTLNANGRAPGLTGTTPCGGFAPDALAAMRGWFSGLEAILPLGEGQVRIGPYAGCVDITAVHRCNAADRSSGACARTVDAMGGLSDASGNLVTLTRQFAERSRPAGQAFGLNGVEPGVGLASGGYAVSSVDFRPMTSVAHEVGHLLGRPHAGCPSSGGQMGEAWPPDGVGLVQGMGIDDRPGSGGTTGPFRIIDSNPTVTASTCSPAEGSSCAGSSMPQATDWMSYCGVGEDRAWISTRNWTTLFSRMRVGASSPPTGVGARSLRAAASPTLLVIALVEGTAARLVSVQPGRRPPASSVGSSATRIVVRDGAGVVVSDTGVAVEPPSEPGKAAMVSAEVPTNGAAARVELVRDGTVVSTITRSANAPKVTVLEPGTARVGAGGRVTVRWRATDADGDPLTASVEYSTDAGRSYRAIGMTEGSFMRLPGRLFARTRTGRLRVVVNDGFDETAGVSRRFAAEGAGPTVRIAYPARRLRVANDAALTLAGQAYDDAGALLSGKRMRWFAGGTFLGTGATLGVHGLPAGARSIRLVATDRFGRRATATVAIRVFASPPQFTVLRAPARMSRGARSVRLRVASAIPATLLVGPRSRSLDRTVRTIVVSVGRRGTAVVRLRLHAAGKTSTRTLRIPRR